MKRAYRDRVAVVTGGASGIGRALGEGLAAHGARVVLADLDGDGAAAAAAAITAADRRARAATVDVADENQVTALIHGVIEREGRLDYLFNNAGIVIAGKSHELEPEDWRRVLDVDLDGVVHGVAAAYPAMIRQGHGHIVNTASLAGLVPAPGLSSYAAAKHAVVGLSTSLRAEAAAFGVKVSVVCPGMIATPIVEHAEIKNEERLSLSRRQLIELSPFRPYPVAKAARIILRGVARNRALILITPHARLLWWLYRLSPTLALTYWRRLARIGPP
ncbi:MAG: SDR family oxidoreductase [Acidobacteria bacterium]|nr:MAG: SDR family oxidoreductase [Acidobacteriota bacterium]